jgi:hypothetical protein
VQHRVDRGANIVQDKGSHQAPSRGENTSERRRNAKSGAFVLGPSGVTKFAIPASARVRKPN